MTFGALRMIRSRRQRALADHWDRLANGRPFPELNELKEIDGLHDPKQLVVWNVEGQGRLQKFKVLYQGAHVAEVFNLAWTGKTLETVVPMPLRGESLAAAKECASRGCLVYTILSTFDDSDRRVECERLLLPFGSGAKVEQIVTSLYLTETRSRLRVLKHFEMHTDTVLHAKIRSSTAPAGGEQADPTGEKRRYKRRGIRHAGRISFAGQKMTCLVHNLSAAGASIEARNLDAIPDDFCLVLEMESIEHPCRVIWRRKSRIGVHFT